MYLWNHLMNKERSYAPSVYKKLVMVRLLRLPKVISLDHRSTPWFGSRNGPTTLRNRRVSSFSW
jgi:hypothetical protein